MPGRMSETRTALIGGFLVALGPVTMSLYTPAMPELVTAFSTTEAAIKLTLSLYFGGFAFAQLVSGTLSDALGRRQATFLFLLIYLVGSIMAVTAPTIEWLLAARLIQGIGASVGMTVSRALVRDQFVGDQAARIMNLIGMILAIGPAAAPTIGGLALLAFGWQSIFLLMVGVAVIACLIAGFAMEETTVPDLAKARPGPAVAAYRRLLSTPSFVLTTLVVGGALGAFYTLAAVLPFILIDRVGLSPTLFGIGMLLQSGTFILSSMVVRWLLGRIKAERLVGPGLFMIGVASLAMMASLQLLPLSFLSVMLPVALYAFGIAFVTPHMMTSAMAPFPDIAGSAAAVLGFVQMGSGLVGGGIAALIGEPVLAMTLVIPGLGLVAILSFVGLRRMDVSAQQKAAALAGQRPD